MQLEIVRPIDGPTGRRRLLDILKAGFANDAYNHFRMIVAFAKVGPLLRLEDRIRRWRAAGKIAEAIFGLDLLGTSKQALQQAAQMLDNVYLTSNNVPNCTFHPKIYLFDGQHEAMAIIGSHNLTVGGLETNFEASALIRMGLPVDHEAWNDVVACWEELLPENFSNTLPLTPEILNTLDARGDLLYEGRANARVGVPRAMAADRPASPFPAAPPKAPTPLTRTRPAAPRTSARTAASGEVTRPTIPPITVVPVQGLLIQIRPHRNGEIFLSKRALDRHPEFFAWPWTGRTTPKKPENPPYPQREPDFAVSLAIYNRRGKLREKHELVRLNTVLYSNKSEIRITPNPGLDEIPPSHSILVMRLPPEGSALDYALEIFEPGSVQYSSYLNACNITLPSGGRPHPRQMGWI